MNLTKENMKSKEDIYIDMIDEMPYNLNVEISSYILEAMQIYADEYHKYFLEKENEKFKQKTIRIKKQVKPSNRDSK